MIILIDVYFIYVFIVEKVQVFGMFKILMIGGFLFGLFQVVIEYFLYFFGVWKLGIRDVFYFDVDIFKGVFFFFNV